MKFVERDCGSWVKMRTTILRTRQQFRNNLSMSYASYLSLSPLSSFPGLENCYEKPIRLMDKMVVMVSSALGNPVF